MGEEAELSSPLPRWWSTYRSWRWDNADLHARWTLATRRPVAELAPLLVLPVWATDPPHHVFDLAPHRVMCDPMVHPQHHARILAAAPSWPLHATRLGEDVVLLDGYHRLARAVLDERDHLDVVEVPIEEIGAATGR